MGRKRGIDASTSRIDPTVSSKGRQVSAVRIVRERSTHGNPQPYDSIKESDSVDSDIEYITNRPLDDGANRPVDEEQPKLNTTVQQLCTFMPFNDRINGRLEDAVTIRLDDNTLTLIGQYELWVRKGAVSLLGAVLHPSSAVYRVFAPSTHSLPVIRSVRNPYGPADQPIEVTITSLRCGIRSLKQVSPMFDRIWNKAIEVSDTNTYEPDDIKPSLSHVKRTYSILKSSNNASYSSKHSQNLLELPKGWQPLLTCLTARNQDGAPTAALVCGPKGSGKSTFVRMLSNGFNDSRGSRCIVLLDIDPGQPEFSPPGEVSLVQISSCHFGPPYCHPSTSAHGLKLIRSHHIGTVSPQDDPQHYMRCVLDLFQYYKQLLVQHPSCPLVVNTAGWIQGSGLELLSECINQMDLTDVVYTSIIGPSEVVDSITQATAERNMRLHLIASQPIEAAPRAAVDLRMMQTLSYFHLDEPEDGQFRWNATSIDEMTTERVHYSGPNQTVYAVQLLGQELDPDFLSQVLEGCIVGLVVVEDDAAFPWDLPPSLPRTTEQIPYIPPTAHITPPLSPVHSYTLGQALIRSVNTTSYTFELVMPIPHTTLASVRIGQRKLILVRGSLDTPTWAYKEDLYKQMWQRKKAVKEGLADDGIKGWAKEDTKQWAEKRDWVTAEGRRKGERVKRVRRDLGKKTTKP
ncbi:MAG: hypothetical protein Q9213_001337 [Squamulea squamosa]